MALYIATDGLMGACTDYYVIVQASKYLGCRAWDLIEESIYWQDIALKCMTAEAKAQEIRKQRGM